MPTFDEEKHVIEKTLSELEQHHQMMANFFASVSEPLQITRGEITKENLWKILLMDIQSRGGPKLNAEKIQSIKTRFYDTLDLEKAKRLHVEHRFRCLFRYLYFTIIALPGIGPKIASVFMKNMVCEFSIFANLKEYLFLPIDLHISNILTDKLRIFQRNELRRDDPLKSRRSNLFQDKIAEIHSPRVDLDRFWYVGYCFCNKRSKLVCSDLCWIRDYCQKHF